ncbi:hypothetical protein Q7P37_001709 [Cladosporium fusiforme]
MRICSLLSNDRPDCHDSAGQSRDAAAVHDDRHHRSRPRSPPYQPADTQKPSLPPLKTVLNGTITSPPDTPPTQQSGFQPRPREPTFSVSTYKPPALYPNKKPRTELGLDPSPVFNPGSSASSPGLPTTNLERSPAYSAQRQGVSRDRSPQRMDYENGRRQSFYQAPASRQSQTSPGTAHYQYARGFVAEAPRRPSEVTSNGSHRSPEQSSFTTSRSETIYAYPSTGQSRPPGDYFPSANGDRYALPTDSARSRRSSVMSPRGYAPSAPVEPAHGGYAPSRPPHYSLPMRDESGPRREDPHYIDSVRTRQPESYSRPVYQDAQPTFFMPSHYDYQQGKTRKRSNLPKHSTEIMKMWFDQNISNPYPSEEQKAIFSHETGISMTQVSNWFINHRRRCPELRDKRDKTRIGGLDSGD